MGLLNQARVVRSKLNGVTFLGLMAASGAFSKFGCKRLSWASLDLAFRLPGMGEILDDEIKTHRSKPAP